MGVPCAIGVLRPSYSVGSYVCRCRSSASPFACESTRDSTVYKRHPCWMHERMVLAIALDPAASPDDATLEELLKLDENREDVLFVDLAMGLQLQIARPSHAYSLWQRSVSSVFVGTARELAQLLSQASDMAAHSFSMQDMDMPPWRLANYLWNSYRNMTLVKLENSTESASAGGAVRKSCFQYLYSWAEQWSFPQRS
eukprot:ANDGO_02476.mRNA.1 hypothetical protein